MYSEQITKLFYAKQDSQNKFKMYGNRLQQILINALTFVKNELSRSLNKLILLHYTQFSKQKIIFIKFFITSSKHTFNIPIMNL